MALGNVVRRTEWNRSLAPAQAVEVCERMRSLVALVSDHPVGEWEVRLSGVNGPVLRGSDLGALRARLRGIDPGDLRQLSYSVREPVLPELSTSLSMQRWQRDALVVEVEGSQRITVDGMAATLRGAVRTALSRRPV